MCGPERSDSSDNQSSANRETENVDYLLTSATSGPYTRDVHRFPLGRGERVVAGAAVVVRLAPLGIDHALATESVQRLVQGGVFAAPRSRPPEDQIGRPAGRSPRTPRRGHHPCNDADSVFAVGDCGPRHARRSECVTRGAKTRDG
jgi:hypothetical protein